MLDNKSATIAAPQDQCKDNAFQRLTQENQEKITFDIVSGETDPDAMRIKRKFERWANGEQDTDEGSDEQPRGEHQPFTPAFDFSLIDNPTPPSNIGLLVVKQAAQWMQETADKPVPQMLFDCLWFEGELCILFSDSNMGKSALAVQICESVASGQAIRGFRLEAPPRVSLYLDFELSAIQFAVRYRDTNGNPYHFSPNFHRVELSQDIDLDDEGEFEAILLQSIAAAVEETGASVVVVDNITFLKNENDKAKTAAPLMRALKRLKETYQLSVLVLGHTPKRPRFQPITQNDLSGSKMLLNFCDSAFAIGRGLTPTSRYIKQIKQRNCEPMYHADNVITCEVVKHGNFLGFDFVGYDTEGNQLATTDTDRDSRREAAKEMAAAGKSQRAIAAELGVSVGTVNSYINN